MGKMLCDRFDFSIISFIIKSNDSLTRNSIVNLQLLYNMSHSVQHQLSIAKTFLLIDLIHVLLCTIYHKIKKLFTKKLYKEVFWSLIALLTKVSILVLKDRFLKFRIIAMNILNIDSLSEEMKKTNL